jgi:hypothetical protein
MSTYWTVEKHEGGIRNWSCKAFVSRAQGLARRGFFYLSQTDEGGLGSVGSRRGHASIPALLSKQGERSYADYGR